MLWRQHACIKQETNRRCAVQSCRVPVPPCSFLCILATAPAQQSVNCASCKTALSFHESLDNLSIKSRVEYEYPTLPNPSWIKARVAFVKSSLFIRQNTTSKPLDNGLLYFRQKIHSSKKDSTSRDLQRTVIKPFRSKIFISHYIFIYILLFIITVL